MVLFSISISSYALCAAGINGTFSSQGGSTQGQRQCLNGRHRRRAGETRLRESQSLNRITEVQEAEVAPPKLPLSPSHAENTEVSTEPLGAAGWCCLSSVC